MEKKLKEELINILQNNEGNMYDFIANNYWLLTKDELKDIALEIVSTMYSQTELLNLEKGVQAYGQENYTNVHKELLGKLKEYRSTLFE